VVRTSSPASTKSKDTAPPVEKSATLRALEVARAVPVGTEEVP
jgi:hypothetical protein